MLAAVLIWLYAGALCYIWGALFFKKLPVSLTILAGLAILVTLAQFFSLFFATGWLTHLIFLSGALIAVFTRRIPPPSWPSFSAWLPSILLTLLFLLVLENATQRALHPDTNLYHAQAVRWIESFPAVPGLGNLHGRLAFNSSWFVANALFSFSFLGLHSFHLLNGFFFFIVALFFWQTIPALLQGGFSLTNLTQAGFLPFTFYVLGGQISSLSTDLPVNLLIWLVAVLWLQSGEQPQPWHPWLIVLFVFFAITIKLSALPLVFMLLPLLWQNKQRILRLTFLAALILLPFLLRNVILSGYLLYPVPALDIFHFDWKVPLERVESDRQDVITFGRSMAAGDVSQPFLQWFPHWLGLQTMNRRILFFTALLTPLAGLFLRFKPRTLWLGWLAIYSSIFFWLASAPDFRFGYGFLLAACLLALVPWLFKASTSFPALRKAFGRAFSWLLMLYLLFTLARSFELRTFADRLLLPTDYDRVRVQACSLANAPAFCAQEYGFCGYSELPCAPSPRYWVELRGADLRDGFRSLPR
ncbi:MAG: membrane protein [Anaerolineales bacterium]